MVNVGVIGIGGMGRLHFGCYGNNPNATVVAICDVDQRKLDGDWASIGLNIDTSSTPRVDLSGIAKYGDYRELITDPSIDIVDICLPTPLHAPAAIAALKAGKDVLCEKPMVRHQGEIKEITDAAEASGKRLLIGHCLRYWGQYVRAAEIVASGEYGKPVYAKFCRAGGTPKWSWNNWLGTGSESGGTVLDMHIHDVDAALWWFGEPAKIAATGIMRGDLPASVDATWTYANGPLVQLHSYWDDNDPSFRYAFTVVMEHATLDMDSVTGAKLMLHRAGVAGEALAYDERMSYQLEIDDLVDAVILGRSITRVTPAASGLAVETALEEIRQISQPA